MSKLSTFLKGILPATWVFQGRERLSLFPIDISAEWKKYIYFCKENHQCKKEEHVKHCFPVRI
jgi:hypothetical protein